MRFSEFNITEGQGGLDYENLVIKSLAAAQIPGLIMGATSAGYSATGEGDIEAVYQGSPLNIEVKMNDDAPMGSGTLVYDRVNGQIRPSASMQSSSDPDDVAIIIGAAETVLPALDNYLDALAQYEPREYHAKQAERGTGFVAAHSAYDELKNQGLMRPINKYVDIPSRFIANKYNAKGTFYIQIGGKGLYYLNTNPLNLPVPQFTGEARIEIRLKRAGDTKGSTTQAFNKAIGNTGSPIQARRVDINAAGRLKSDIAPSPYTLDDPASVRALFGV